MLIAVGLLVAILILMDIYMFRSEPLMFWLSLPVLLTVSGLTLGKLFQIRQNEHWYFDQMTGEIRSADSLSLIQFPLPVCVVDDNGSIIWSNKEFDAAFFVPNEDESFIDDVTNMPAELFGADGREIQYKDKWFRVHSVVREFAVNEKAVGRYSGRHTIQERDKITMLIFRDVTDYKMLRNSYEMSKPVVMVVMVDNYEELLSGAKESERANVTGQVDTLIEEYFSEKKAVMKKISGDKFLIVLEQQYLKAMIDEKMAIINKAHDIKVRERTSVTLSIGVGATAKSLAEGERFASEMLEKALERGGDQALVKTAEGFTPYGASSAGRERTVKIKIRLAAEEIKSLIETADTVYIMGHSFGDFDSAGASVGLTCAIRRLGIPAYAVARFRDETKTNAKGLFEKFVDYDMPVVIEPNEAEQWITERSVLIIVDTHIEKKLDDPELFQMADKSRVVIIDHHRLSGGAITEFAVRCHEPNASSASELVTELIQYFSGTPLINANEAEALLAGIVLDTKDFVMRSGVSTFEAAAYLKKIGADTVNVKKLFDTTIENKLRKSEIISSAAMYRARCAIAVVEHEIPGIRVLCSQAADEMLYIRNVEAAFTVYPIGESDWSISARSFGKINVQIIMEKLGNKKDDGGGHLSMAGAQLRNMPLDEVVDRLHKAIDEFFEENAQTKTN